MKRTKIRKLLFVLLGFICLTLGAVGVIMPLLPTTPLVLFAAFCFAYGNKKWEKWLIHNRLFGPYIEAYRTHQGISKRRKIVTLIYLWVGLFASMFIIRTPTIYIILSTIGTAVTIHLLMMKTKK